MNTVSRQQAGRNDPCPCGSGRKYKHCCGAVASDPPAARAQSLVDAANELRAQGKRLAAMLQVLPGTDLADLGSSLDTGRGALGERAALLVSDVPPGCERAAQTA